MSKQSTEELEKVFQPIIDFPLSPDQAVEILTVFGELASYGLNVRTQLASHYYKLSEVKKRTIQEAI